MNFRFFGKLSFCQTCGCAFKALKVGDPGFNFGHLCTEHRKEPMEIARRKARVMAYVGSQWERFEKQVAKEEEAAMAPYRDALNRNLAAAMNAQAQAGAYNHGMTNNSQLQGY